MLLPRQPIRLARRCIRASFGGESTTSRPAIGATGWIVPHARGRGRTPLDERALLYDQAFALLGYAARRRHADRAGNIRAPSARIAWRHREPARRQRRRLSFERGAAGERRESNPHMHLLEACLAWAQAGRDGGWSAWAKDLIDLALSRFIRPETGALRRIFFAILGAGSRDGRADHRAGPPVRVGLPDAQQPVGARGGRRTSGASADRGRRTRGAQRSRREFAAR